MKRILITGANRGIGLAFVRQYLERGERVIAACRVPRRAADLLSLEKQYPAQLSLVQMIVSKRDTIDEAYEAVSQWVDGLDILINNAGIYNAPDGDGPVYGDDDAPQQLGLLDFEPALAVLRTNTIAPIIVAQRFLALLQQGQAARVVNITSGMGSISDASSGGSYYYATSKAALNMMTRRLAFDLKKVGILAVALDPGWVQTDMGGTHAAITADESAKGMIAFIDGMTASQSGGFYDYTGAANPW